MKRMGRTRFLAVSALLLAASSAAAEAERQTGARSSPLAHMLIMDVVGVQQIVLPPQNTCIVYGYDKNGNRLSQVKTNVVSQAATWGAAPYLCFVWSGQ